jgi:hypothetical protein
MLRPRQWLKNGKRANDNTCLAVGGYLQVVALVLALRIPKAKK